MGPPCTSLCNLLRIRSYFQNYYFTNSKPAHIFLLDSAPVANDTIEWTMDKLMNERMGRMLPRACAHLFDCKNNSRSKILHK